MTITRYIGSGGNVTIPDEINEKTVTAIGNNAFSNCTSLTSVAIGNSVTSIGNYAFRFCTSLTSITIPNSVASIGEGTFSRCASLTSIIIPNSVTTIGNFALNGCTNLTNIDVDDDNPKYSSIDGVLFNNDKTTLVQYPIGKTATAYEILDTVTSIQSSAFAGCLYLTDIKAGANNSNYSSIDGVLFNKDKTTLILYPAGKAVTSYEIPISVVGIGNYAFYNCTTLTDVTIGNSVKSIGSSAFSGCTSLTSVTIPNNVMSIGNQTFYNCTSLASVTIGNSVANIGNYAFQTCTSLSSVIIPYSVTNIGTQAFYCTNLYAAY